jgi:hypothetical protein
MTVSQKPGNATVTAAVDAQINDLPIDDTERRAVGMSVHCMPVRMIFPDFLFGIRDLVRLWSCQYAMSQWPKSRCQCRVGASRTVDPSIRVTDLLQFEMRSNKG